MNLNYPKVRSQVHIDNFLNVFGLTFSQRNRAEDSSVIHQDVDGAEGTFHVTLQLLDCVIIRDINLICGRWHIELFGDFRRRSLRLNVVDVDDDDFAIFLRQSEGYCSTQAICTT